MSQYTLKMPKLGEGIMEATITKWLKQTGDHVDIDEAVLEIATDKVDSEVPSPVEGILKEQLFNEGDTVAVESIIARIETDSDVSDPEDTAEPPLKDLNADITTDNTESGNPQLAEQLKTPEPIVQSEESTDAKRSAKQLPAQDRFYSPLVRNIAKEEGLSIEELYAIPGSGKDGRLTKADLIEYLNSGKRGAGAQAEKKPQIQTEGGDEIIVMDRVRKLIAEHMIMSEATSVHITLFGEADMTNLVHWRNKQKEFLLKRENEKLTFTPIFIEAIAQALHDHPMVNISLDGDRIIKRKRINIGMATSLPNGNLIVPVIKNADQKSLIEITREVNDLANRARSFQLKPDEIKGGTFTLTNFGTFGAKSGTPIINQPQVAILGVGLIEKKPAVVETPQGDAIAIRHKMILSLSCDHRVVDGALGSQFMKSVIDHLENFNTNQNI